MKIIGLAFVLACTATACGPSSSPMAPPVSAVGSPRSVDSSEPVRRAITVDAAESPNAVTSADPTLVAVRNGLEFLRVDGDRWMRGQVGIQNGAACVSCHHVGYALWAHREAQRHDLTAPDPRIDDLRRRAVEYLLLPDKLRAVTSTQILLSGADANEEPLEPFVRYFADSAEADGNWRARGQFPDQNRPIEESDAVASHWALLALLERAPVGSVDLDRSLTWLDQAASGTSVEWLASRLAVEHALGHEAAIPSLRRALLDAQGEDGGWSWQPGDPSNAFSTGQALYVLAAFDEPEITSAVDRGVRYLQASQEIDGTWAVPSRLTSAKPSQGKDVIYRFWGTAWAVLGLSRTHSPHLARIPDSS